MKRYLLAALVLALPTVVSAQSRLAPGALADADRPFGTLREQAAMQQAWLKKRLDTFLPALMLTETMASLMRAGDGKGIAKI